MNVFDTVKERLDIAVVAEFYGLQPDRHGKCLCPFHDDHHRSLSLDSRRQCFCCFACGAKGDLIKLAQRLTGENTAFKTIKRLNSDFRLGITELDDKPQSKTERQKAALERAERGRAEKQKQMFRSLIDRAAMITATYFRILHFWQMDFAPVGIDDVPDKRYIFAMQNISRAEFLAELFTEQNNADMLDYFKCIGFEEVRQIAEFCKRFR